MIIFSFPYSIIDIKNSDYNLELNDNDPEEFFNSPKTASALATKEAYAIVIGVADYPGADNDLSYTDDDANDVYDMLVNDYNFKPSNIIRLLDSNATKASISAALDYMASVITPNDIFFFYYSGHGGANLENGGTFSHSINSPHPYPNDYDNYWSITHSNADYMRVHFTTIDVEEDFDYVFVGDSDLFSGWYYEAFTGYSTNIWSSWIPLLSDNTLVINLYTDYSITEWGFRVDKYEMEFYDGTHFLASYDSIPNNSSNYYIDTLLDSKLDNIAVGAEKYVVLDACNTGGMIPEIQEIGRYIMTACEAEELSLESSALQHGVFTNYLLRSNNFASDLNGDGTISMEESFSYTYSNTVSYSESVGYTHHPQEYDGISGENILNPSLGSFSLVPIGNTLTYSFDIYGSGLIEELSVVVANVSHNYIYAIEDLTLNSPTVTGFGSYSGTIQLPGGLGFDSYGFFATISGNIAIHLDQTVSQDADGDLLDDISEIYIGSDPEQNDTDSDGLDDYFEYYGETDPTLYDTDSDGLSDGEEILIYFTSGANPDTDGDQLSDGEEVLVYFTNPLSEDTEGDGMDDYYEYYNNLSLLVDDANLDKDNDGLLNLLEFQLTSQANNSDSDNDNMPDGWEYNNYLNLLVNDASLDYDGDGLNNLLEYQYGSLPSLSDSDGDFMSDLYEYNCGLDSQLDDANLDKDNDGIDNLVEFLLGSEANDIDSDNDNMLDGWEYDNNLNLIQNDALLDPDSDDLSNYEEYTLQLDPQSPDTDNDGLSDGDEVLVYHTDPLNKDTDGDGFSDGLEVLWFSNPLDPKISIITQIFTISGFIMLGGTSYSVVRTKIISKKHSSQEDKYKLKKFKIDKKVKIFNGLTVEKTVKPKPKPIIKRPIYQQPQLPRYLQPSTQPIPNRQNIDFNNIKDIIQHGIPPPKPRNSAAGKRASLAANIGFKLLNQGKYTESLEYLVNALMLGVPEPMNSRIKNILLDAINRISNQSTSNSFGSSNYSNITNMKKCLRCGTQNQLTYKFCLDCGELL